MNPTVRRSDKQKNACEFEYILIRNMHIFGISFMLFILNLSSGNGYWLNFRNSDEERYRKAVKIQRLRKKLVRCEMAIKFLVQFLKVLI